MQKYYYRNGKRITREQLEAKIQEDSRLYRAIASDATPPATKIINNAGTCKHCKTQAIQYGIKNGNYTYYCHTCGLYITTWDIIN